MLSKGELSVVSDSVAATVQAQTNYFVGASYFDKKLINIF